MLVAEEATPCLHQLVYVLSDGDLNPRELLSAEPLLTCERHRIEPELRDATITPDVDMRRFTKLVGVEEEPVGSDDLDRWRHLLDSSIALGLTRCEMSGSLRTVACVHAHRTRFLRCHVSLCRIAPWRRHLTTQ